MKDVYCVSAAVLCRVWWFVLGYVLLKLFIRNANDGTFNRGVIDDILIHVYN